MTELRIERIAKAYGGVAALRDVSLDVPAGGITVLMGPSGCGKSTLLKVVAGLVTADGGDVRIGGRPVLALPPERRGAVLMGQEAMLFTHLSVIGNVGFGLRMRGKDRGTVADRSAEMLRLVRLDGYGQRRVDALSGGEAQRVALARALVTQPAVLLLDEPLSALDPTLREEMRGLVRDVLRATATTALFVTHDRDEAFALADRLAIMSDGRILQEGDPRTLYEQPASPAAAGFFGPTNVLVGAVSGTRLRCDLGEVVVGPGPDGPATFVIRPEAVRLADAADPSALSGVVQTADYRGTHLVLTVAIGAGTLIAAVDPIAARGLERGSPVALRLPADRLWRLPAVTGA